MIHSRADESPAAGTSFLALGVGSLTAHLTSMTSGP
ncbi:hypothetical protein HNR40_009576 [Nonomuraea endophytica]|uniref:Uncharacterized protein n=1 Tax=Nonomuraea endophytica TaxID=714136 RepID=A0A7W8EM57_9ACTN|nr:hypothetical protein [Nonomuraea endophytica]